MKRGSDGEKIMGPMFPRLHVNDTEKGGPRAPPRNKMALYEQLSIPSQRFSHAVMPHNPNNKAASSVPPSSLGGGNDGGMFCARQVHPAYPSEKQYGQHSELSTSLAQVEQRKKIDDDDYTVPIFIQPIPTEFDKYSKGFSQEKLSPSNPPYLHSSVKPHLGNEIGMLKISIGQEGGCKKRENSNESVSGRKQISLMSHEPGVNLANGVDRLRTDDSGQPDLCAESQLSHNSRSTAAMGANKAAAAKRSSSNLEESLQLGDQNIDHDLSYVSESGEDDGSCRSLHAGNLERGDSVSETSILDTESALEITPDDVVGTIGQKHFWKARRAIMNQQRVFAVQVFELHRLIKVQRLIAASPHLLHDDDACFEKSTKPSQGKKRPLDYAISNAFKAKGDSENQSHKKERSAENTVEKPPFSSPSSCMPSAGSGAPASVLSSDHKNNGGASHFNHPMPQGHQWLMPVMTPSEGLVYKPCLAPGFVGQGYGPPGSNPMMDNFLALPVYGVPAPAPQYPFFPPYGPHGYFPHYGMPIMSSAAFSGGSVGQMHASAQESTSTVPSQNNGSVPDGPNQCAAEEIIVPGSSSERQRPGPGSRVSNCVEGRNMLPSYPATNSNPRVIKVVPRNGISASESAARIFQSIQEERKQFDSV